MLERLSPETRQKHVQGPVHPKQLCCAPAACERPGASMDTDKRSMLWSEKAGIQRAVDCHLELSEPESGALQVSEFNASGTPVLLVSSTGNRVTNIKIDDRKAGMDQMGSVLKQEMDSAGQDP